MVNTLPHLESLIILRCEEVTAVGLAMIGRFCGRLQKLTIEGVNGSDMGGSLQLIGRGCATLTELSLVDHNPSSEDDMLSTDVRLCSPTFPISLI